MVNKQKKWNIVEIINLFLYLSFSLYFHYAMDRLCSSHIGYFIWTWFMYKWASYLRSQLVKISLSNCSHVFLFQSVTRKMLNEREKQNLKKKTRLSDIKWCEWIVSDQTDLIVEFFSVAELLLVLGKPYYILWAVRIKQRC